MASEKLRTAAQAKAWLRMQGLSVSEWARMNGFSTALAAQVLTGVRPCHRGASHNIALALGMKAGIPTDKLGRIPGAKRTTTRMGGAAYVQSQT